MGFFHLFVGAEVEEGNRGTNRLTSWPCLKPAATDIWAGLSIRAEWVKTETLPPSHWGPNALGSTCLGGRKVSGTPVTLDRGRDFCCPERPAQQNKMSHSPQKILGSRGEPLQTSPSR